MKRSIFLLLMIPFTHCGRPIGGGGVPLAGATNVVFSDGFGFTLSPDGQYLVYNTQGGNAFDPRLTLLNLKTQIASPVRITSEADAMCKQGRGPRLEQHYWKNHESLVFFGETCQFILETSQRPFQLRVHDRETPELPEVTDRFAVVRSSAHEVALTDRANDKILMHHRVKQGGRIEIHHLIPSPSHRHIAYQIVSSRGSLARNPILYRLSLGASENEAEVLAQAVFGPVCWDQKGKTVYALVKIGRQFQIYRWKNN